MTKSVGCIYRRTGLVLLLLTGLRGHGMAQLPTVAPAERDSVTYPAPFGPPNNRYRPTLRQLAVPTVLLGVAVLSTKGVDLLKIDAPIQAAVQRHFPQFQTTIDDQLRHVPAVAALGLSLAGVKGEHSTVNQGVIFFLAYTINNTLTSNLKTLTHVERPYGNDFSSFPSQHTSAAFAAATFLHREYGGRSIWYSIGGYSVAAATGGMRMAKDAHWLSDVLAGAGVGILSTEAAYWLYPRIMGPVRKVLGSPALVLPSYQQGTIGATAVVRL